MSTRKKHEEYAMLLITVIGQVFDEDSENYISDLFEDDNATEFIHALANLAPTLICNRLTEGSLTHLEFNHLANGLILQNAVIDAKGR